MSAKWRALPFPHLPRYRLAADQDCDGHSTDNPNNATPEPCRGDARRDQYTIGLFSVSLGGKP